MGKGGSKTRLPAGMDALSLIQAGFAGKAVPARTELLSQITEALRTGGAPGARIPIIQRAVEAQKQATSQALTSTSEELAKRNIGGPFAGRAMAQVRQQGEQAAANIPTQVAQQLIGQASTVPFQIPGGQLASGSASTTTPDTLTPALGAGGAVLGAVILAI